MSQRYIKKNAKKRTGYENNGKAKKVKYSGPLEYYNSTKVTSGKWIDVHKWIQGAFIAHSKDFGLVAQRIELNPGAETAYIDEITEEMCNVNIDDYDFGDAQQVARYNADSKSAVRQRELRDQRMKLHAAIKEKIDNEVLKRAKVNHPEAVYF